MTNEPGTAEITPLPQPARPDGDAGPGAPRDRSTGAPAGPTDGGSPDGSAPAPREPAPGALAPAAAAPAAADQNPANPDPDPADHDRVPANPDPDLGNPDLGIPHGAPPAPGPDPVGPDRAPGAGVLAVLTLAWLAAMLWSAQAAISSAELAEMALTSTAYALPGAITASLVGGAGTALALIDALARRGAAARVATRGRRFTVAAGTGLVTGLLAGAAVLLTYGEGRTVTVVAGTIAAAGTIGGAAAGIRPARPVAAVLAGSLGVFAVGFLLNLFQAPLLNLYGSADTRSSQASALGWFALTASVLSGVVAGLLAFGYLRRTREDRTGGHRAGAALRWPAYAATGAGAGLVLLTAELLARTAGAQVLALAGTVSEADRAAQTLLNGSRVNNALIVIFVGAVVGILAVGRTMQPASAGGTADHA